MLSRAWPEWNTLCVSLSDKAAATAGLVSFWPVGLNFSSYKAMMADSKFFHSFWTSVQRVVLGGALSCIVIVRMAYPFSKSVREFKQRKGHMDADRVTRKLAFDILREFCQRRSAKR
jgi:putative aldouronate transport system permease protein